MDLHEHGDDFCECCGFASADCMCEQDEVEGGYSPLAFIEPHRWGELLRGDREATQAQERLERKLWRRDER